MTQPKQLSPEECLLRIKPALPPRRFLISWDCGKRELWYGLGAGENVVLVGSGGQLVRPENAGDVPDSRLSTRTVQDFLGRSLTVDGTTMFDQCRTFLRSYLYFKDERFYDLLSVWIIGTYHYPMFSHFGYLFAHSNSPRCGKSRLLELVSHLGFEATSPLNGPTVPTIREYASEGRTLTLDTVERWKGKSPEAYSAAMEYLDAGFRSGSKVAKMVSDGNGKWQKKEFPVYTPYVLAGIDKDSLADTALDRSFVFEMHRKPRGLRKRKYNHFQCEEDCQPLRSQLYLWALQNAREVAQAYEGAELEAKLDGMELNDRAADIWKPLLALTHVLGNAELWQTLTSLAVEMGQDTEAAEREQVRAIARSLRKLVHGNGTVVGMTSDLAKHLREDGLECDERDLHDVLTQCGFSQQGIRLEQGPRRAWELQDAKLAEIERENEPLSPSENVTTVTTQAEAVGAQQKS